MNKQLESFKEQATDIIQLSIDKLNDLKDTYDLALEENEEVTKQAELSMTEQERQITRNSIFGAFAQTTLFSVSFIAMFLGNYWIMIAGLFGMLLHTWIDFFRDIKPRVQDLLYL